MSNKVMISKENSNRIRVQGRLSIETVAEYQRKGFEAMDEVEGHVVFDMSGSDVVGSAALALLISWQRRAIALKKTFVIENAPIPLLEMAEVSGVREIIMFKDDAVVF